MSEQNTAEMIDRLYELREQKGELNAKIKEVDKEFKKLEFTLLAKLLAEGVSSSSTDKAKASVSKSVVPNVVDWPAVYDWIRETDSIYVLERRFSVTAFRELLQMGEDVPGVEAFTKTEISLRKN